jgi:hypothetical protein
MRSVEIGQRRIQADLDAQLRQHGQLRIGHVAAQRAGLRQQAGTGLEHVDFVALDGQLDRGSQSAQLAAADCNFPGAPGPLLAD